MSRARSAIAARTSSEKFFKAAIKAFGLEVQEETTVEDDFYDAVQFCRPRTESTGGDDNDDCWYTWQHGDWALVGDLGNQLHLDSDALKALSAEFGELIVASIDSGYEYAAFIAYKDGKLQRRLVLEDGEYDEAGVPVAAERGQHRMDFSEEECERIWVSYKLPTFEYDPEVGPFTCQALKRP